MMLTHHSSLTNSIGRADLWKTHIKENMAHVPLERTLNDACPSFIPHKFQWEGWLVEDSYQGEYESSASRIHSRCDRDESAIHHPHWPPLQWTYLKLNMEKTCLTRTCVWLHHNIQRKQLWSFHCYLWHPIYLEKLPPFIIFSNAVSKEKIGSHYRNMENIFVMSIINLNDNTTKHWESGCITNSHFITFMFITIINEDVLVLFL